MTAASLFRRLTLAAALAAASSAAFAEAPPSSLSAGGKQELTELLAAPLSWTSVDLFRNKLPRVPADAFDRFMMWNEIALDTTAIDHTPLTQGDPRPGYAEQFGPHRASRAMAIVHIAMFEAVNGMTGRFESYTGLPAAHGRASMDRAMAQAAHDALAWLYPYQKTRLDALLAQDAATMKVGPQAMAEGQALGADAASSIVAMRTGDGSELAEQSVGTGPEDYHVHPGPGWWSPDPVSGLTLALGARWGQVKPFVMKRGDQFRPAPPPSLNSHAFAVAYRHVAMLGGDPEHDTPTTRTPEQTFIGRFWGYDGTPALCAPPRLYNMVARTVALGQGMSDVAELARFMALVNTAMADAAIAAWESKWHYQTWRPVTGIRRGDEAGNPEVRGVPTWYPSGAPATNTSGPNFTPPFPAYPSGHATLGGALFEVFRAYWPDATRFTLVSDEFNGQNRDAEGNLRPLIPQTFTSFTQAEHDNAESRIYNGVHWDFDATAGIAAGHQVAHEVLSHAFRRVRPTSD